MDAKQQKECEELQQEKMREFEKAGLVIVVALVILACLCLVSPRFQPLSDPLGFVARILWALGLLFVAIIGIVGSASAVNWVTKGDWWAELEEGNIAVGISSAGLFICVGLALLAIV